MTFPEVAVGSPTVSDGVNCQVVESGLVIERKRPSVALKLNEVAPHRRLPNLAPTPLVSPNSTIANTCHNIDNNKNWSSVGRSMNDVGGNIGDVPSSASRVELE